MEPSGRQAGSGYCDGSSQEVDMLIPHQPPEPQEHWLRFKSEAFDPLGTDVVVVSGYKYYTDGHVTGSPMKDSKAESHECRVFVGPRWREVGSVSPLATISAYSHYNSDETDDSGYGVDLCKWDFELTKQPQNGAQIMLKVFLHARGGLDLSIRGVSYQVVARGSLVPGQESDFENHRQL
jgi:hypothetical protein